MARPVRLNIPHALYLVQIRSKDESRLFANESDRQLFLTGVGEAAPPTGVSIYSFALMEKSVLLLVRSGTLPLSKFVHQVQSRYFNRLRVLSGESVPLLRDRHREILIEERTCFPEVIRRVHLAPIIGDQWSNQSEARKWGEVSTNNWTSFPVVLGKEKPLPGFDRDFILDLFRDLDSGKPESAFYKFIIDGVKELDHDILEHVVAMSLLGSPEFVDRYREGVRGHRRVPVKYRKASALNDHTFKKKLSANVIFKHILKQVCAEFDVEAERLLRKGSRHEGRKFLMELSFRYALGDGGVKELGERFGVSGSALAHRRTPFLEELSENQEIAGRFNKLEAMLKKKVG